MERDTNKEQQERSRRGTVSLERPEVEDAWAGEDQDWEHDSAVRAESRQMLSFFRGLFLSLLLGALVWGLVAFALYYAFFA
jgi:hypothetical protein